MYNYTMLIGRLCTDIQVSKTNNGSVYSKVLIAVQRPFKNAETNQYDSDFIPVTLFDALCDLATNHFVKGDLIAIKGRLSTNNVELNTGAKINALNIIAERIMFISQKKNS